MKVYRLHEYVRSIETVNMNAVLNILTSISQGDQFRAVNWDVGRSFQYCQKLWELNFCNGQFLMPNRKGLHKLKRLRYSRQYLSYILKLLYLEIYVVYSKIIIYYI